VSYGNSWVRLEGEGRFERRMVASHHASAELVANLVANLVREPGEDWSSRKRTTPELVASAKPEFAVISVGSGSSFGLPRTDALNRLAYLSKLGARACRTDLDGMVTFHLAGHSVTPSLGALQASQFPR
jgi:hypothetical protein